jgi:hypothetical protein
MFYEANKNIEIIKWLYMENWLCIQHINVENTPIKLPYKVIKLFHFLQFSPYNNLSEV